jgi:hypothetical protein
MDIGVEIMFDFVETTELSPLNADIGLVSTHASVIPLSMPGKTDACRPRLKIDE